MRQLGDYGQQWCVSLVSTHLSLKRRHGSWEVDTRRDPHTRDTCVFVE